MVLWTRLSPYADNDKSNVTVSGSVALFSHENDAFVAASDSPACVEWQLWTNTSGGVADSGTAYTSSDIDWTVKVEAQRLQPFTEYCESKR